MKPNRSNDKQFDDLTQSLRQLTTVIKGKRYCFSYACETAKAKALRGNCKHQGGSNIFLGIDDGEVDVATLEACDDCGMVSLYRVAHHGNPKPYRLGKVEPVYKRMKRLLSQTAQPA